MSERSDNPGVRLPPPALYALAVLFGALLNRRWPFPIGGGATVQALAWMLVAASLALMGSGIGRFRRARTSIVPIRVFLIPVLFAVRIFVIAPEERSLERRFGADYLAYKKRVRRWL